MAERPKCLCGSYPDGAVVERNGRVMHIDCALQASEERAEWLRVALEEAIGLAESGWFRPDRFQSEAMRELERIRALAADQTGGE